MNEHCETIQYAYDLGYEAGQGTSTVGLNPFDPTEEPKCYEAWLDGWVAGCEEITQAEKDYEQ